MVSHWTWDLEGSNHVFSAVVSLGPELSLVHGEGIIC